MARCVYLHIGVPKSGTTYLQTMMWHNREPLRQQGFLYPGSTRMDHYHASRGVRTKPGQELQGEGSDAWDRLVGELAAWPGIGLISHEFFSIATRRQARAAVEALRPADVHVVVTIRDYVRQFPAVWQEALKVNSDRSFDEFMAQAFAQDLSGAWGWNSQDVPAVLERWSHAVPRDRVHVITVPRPGAQPTVLWDRWCRVIGVDDSEFDFAVSFDNQSLGAPQAALLHRLKPYLTDSLASLPVRHRWVRQYFGHEVLVPQQGQRFGPRPEHAAELRRLSMQAAKAIESAGYPVTGDLSELVPDERAQLLPHPDDVDETAMLDVALRAIEQMIRDVRSLTDDRDRWRREARRHQAPVAPKRPAAVETARASVPRRVARRIMRRLGR